jgi:hypothetical protein
MMREGDFVYRSNLVVRTSASSGATSCSTGNSSGLATCSWSFVSGLPSLSRMIMSST